MLRKIQVFKRYYICESKNKIFSGLYSIALRAVVVVEIRSGRGNEIRIQDMIDNVSDGDTVFVYSGWYARIKLLLSVQDLV